MPGSKPRATISKPKVIAAKRPMRADALRNRELVFAAAKACFARTGAKTSMEAIARRAGLGVGTLYRAFGSRAGLAEAIYGDMVEELAKAATRLTSDNDPWTALVGWLRAYLAQMLSKWTMMSVLEPLFDANPRVLTQSRVATASALETVLAPVRRAGVVREDLVAMDLMLLVNGIVTGEAAFERVEILLDVILRGIRIG